jgi:hypothetical protein
MTSVFACERIGEIKCGAMHCAESRFHVSMVGESFFLIGTVPFRSIASDRA